MKDWIKRAIEETKGKEGQAAQIQDWARYKQDKLDREGWSVWEDLRAVLTADAREIERGHSIGLTVSEARSDPGLESIRVERQKSPALGLLLSINPSKPVMTLQLYKIDGRERQRIYTGEEMKSHIDVDSDGQLVIALHVGPTHKSIKNVGVEEMSRGLLTSILAGDLTRISQLVSDVALAPLSSQ